MARTVQKYDTRTFLSVLEKPSRFGKYWPVFRQIEENQKRNGIDIWFLISLAYVHLPVLEFLPKSWAPMPPLGRLITGRGTLSIYTNGFCTVNSKEQKHSTNRTVLTLPSLDFDRVRYKRFWSRQFMCIRRRLQSSRSTLTHRSICVLALLLSAPPHIP